MLRLLLSFFLFLNAALLIEQACYTLDLQIECASFDMYCTEKNTISIRFVIIFRSKLSNRTLNGQRAR